MLNSSSPGQNGHQFAEDIMKCSFINEKFCLFIQQQLNFATTQFYCHKHLKQKYKQWNAILMGKQ